MFQNIENKVCLDLKGEKNVHSFYSFFFVDIIFLFLCRCLGDHLILSASMLYSLSDPLHIR